MLNDQDGICMRVTKLYKHQDTILIKAQQMINKLKNVESDNQVKNILIHEQSEALNHNYDELRRYIDEMDKGYRTVETELVSDLKEQSLELKEQQETIKELQETIDSIKQETLKAQQNREEEHKLRLETDKQMKEVMVENNKLK